MALKLASLAVPKKIPKWVNLSAFISSLPCPNENFPEEGHNNNPPTPSTLDFEASVQFLRNRLAPDNLIRVLDDSSDLSSAVKVFKWASAQKKFHHTAETHCRMILKLGLSGNVLEMKGFWQNMVSGRCPGVDEAVVSLIGSFVENGKLNEAVWVLENMGLCGFKPSLYAFNLVLSSLVEEKRKFSDVLFVYKEMVKVGLVPNVDTLNSLFEALFEAELVESALNQYRRMNRKGCRPNCRTFEVLVKGLIVKNRVDEADKVLSEMFEIGCWGDASFYASVIPLFCRENKLEDGLRLFRMMKDSKLVPGSVIYEELICCLCENSRLDDANKLLEEMIESGAMPDDEVSRFIIDALCKIGKLNEAIEFLEDKHVLGTSPHNALLNGCCHADNFLTAKGVFSRMVEKNITDCDSWNILIRWLCENMEIKTAYEFLARMFRSSLVPDCATYSALVVGLCKLSKCEDALQIFRQVRTEGWVLDAMAYSELIDALCRVKKVSDAIEVFHYMSKCKHSLQSSSLNNLIEGICESQNVEEAIRLHSLARSSGTSCDVTTYSTIMLWLSKSGKTKNILPVLAQMLVEGYTLDAKAYCILIESMSSQNRIKDCVKLFNLLINDGLVPDSKSLFKLLSCLASHSQLRAILTAIDNIVFDCDSLSPEIFNLLINGLWREGDKSGACRLLDLMLENGWIPDSTTHGLLIGDIGREETDGIAPGHENSSVRDNVSEILAEGLEKV